MSQTCFRCCLLLLASAVPLLPQVATAQTRPLAIEDLFRVAGVASPAVSPDGSLVAYVLSTRDLDANTDRSDIWMVETAGGEPRRMTTGGTSSNSPAFSPDGRYLSFLASRGEESETQVWAMRLAGGEAEVLTDVENGVRDYAWAPDGTRLALLIRDAEAEREDGKPRPPWVVDRLQFKRDYQGYLDRRRTHLFVLDIDSRVRTRLTDGDYEHSSPVWSPDGTRIAFVSNRTSEPDANYNTDVWWVEASSGPLPELTRVSAASGGDDSPVWSPDGRSMAWLTSLRPEVGGYAMSHLATGSQAADSRVLTEELDRSLRAPRFTSDGRSVLGILESEGAEHLVSVALDGGAIETIVGGERSVAAFEPLASGGAIVLASAASAPRELWRTEPGREPVPLTRHNAALLAEVELGPVLADVATAPDGTRVETFYTFPPGTDPQSTPRLPAILWIHGGPMGQDGWSWNALRHLFAAQGYLVVQPNYRGSHGYGQEFALGLWQDWGGPESVDAIAGVDHGIERGWADPDRLGVGGWSYGGITTNAIITSTDRFKAAISGAGAALWVAGYGHDQYQRWYEQELGLPWENPDLWNRISTFWRVDQITTPTLWMGGEQDWNVPINQGELMYQSMKRLGRETLLVVYPGQGHSGFPPVYEADRYERYLGWFGRYLLGDDRHWPKE